MDYETQHEAAVVAAVRKIVLAWHEEGMTFDHLEQYLEQYLEVLTMEVQRLERRNKK